MPDVKHKLNNRLPGRIEIPYDFGKPHASKKDAVKAALPVDPGKGTEGAGAGYHHAPVLCVPRFAPVAQGILRACRSHAAMVGARRDIGHGLAKRLRRFHGVDRLRRKDAPGTDAPALGQHGEESHVVIGRGYDTALKQRVESLLRSDAARGQMGPVGMGHSQRISDALLEELLPALAGNRLDRGPRHLETGATVFEYRTRRIDQRAPGDRIG